LGKTQALKAKKMETKGSGPWLDDTHLSIPALRRLRQDDHKLKASLGYILTPCLKKKKTVANYLAKRI
jgi:hypothetical protein